MKNTDLGSLAKHRDAFTWVVRTARISGTDADLLGELLAHPAGQFLAELNLAPTRDMTPLFAVLAKRTRPTIETLAIFETDTEVAHVDVGNLGKIWKALPNLTHFWINTSGFTLGRIVAPRLTALDIGTDGLTKANVKSIAAIEAPELERLDLSFGEPDRGATGSTKEIAPLLRRRDLPKLRHLMLDAAAFADDLVALVATSTLLPQLETLSFAGGALTDKGAAVLAKHARAFRHLASIDLDDNYLTAAGRKLVKGLAKKVSTQFQKEADDDDERYVGSWE